MRTGGSRHCWWVGIGLDVRQLFEVDERPKSKVFYVHSIIFLVLPFARADMQANRMQLPMLTRARVAFSATFALVGGGGSKWPRDLIEKLLGIERRGKKRSMVLDEYNRKCFSHFSLRFAQVNIEVIRGHQMSILVSSWTVC